MNASSEATARRSPEAFPAIAAAGLIAGILGITSAFIIYGAKGVGSRGNQRQMRPNDYE